MLHQRTQFLILLFVLSGIALEVSATIKINKWNPNAWIGPDKDENNSDEGDLDLCHGYVESQALICNMILNLTRISRSSLGPKLQDAIDTEHVWCTKTIEAQKTVLSAEVHLLDESLRVAKETILFLANRETELDLELEEAKKSSALLQKKLDEMKRNQQQDANYLAEKKRLEEELAAARAQTNQINDKKDKLKLEKDRLSFHFKRVTKENEALTSQIGEIQSENKERKGNQEVCEAQVSRITKLEQDLQNSTNDLLNTQTACKVKADKLELKVETRLQEIQRLKEQVNTLNNNDNEAQAKNKATILLLQQREQQSTTKIENLQSQVNNLQSELLETKQKGNQCKNEGEKLKTEKRNVETNLQRCTSSNVELEKEKKTAVATLKAKTSDLETCIQNSITTTIRTTTIRTTQKPAVAPPGTVKLGTGTYLFQGMVGGKYLAWEPARQHCLSLGMDLVAIETQEENAALAAYGRSLPLFRSWMAWTSGCFSKERKTFVWHSTSAALTYKNLINPRSIETTNAPSCIGFMSVLAKWSTLHPTQQIQPFICELSK